MRFHLISFRSSGGIVFSGIDPDKVRGFLVTMACASGRRQTGMLDSHPAGPERIAGWDQAAAEIRASNGQLPGA